MSSPDPREAGLLLEVAHESLRRAVAEGRPWLPDPGAYPRALREHGASFVTLRRGDALRGCIGVLEPVRPLVVDVAHNAWAAGFRDPRFPPLERAELEGLEVHISLLAPREPLACASEDELLAQLRPGVDGLVLEDGPFRGTFLPAVWESLPDPRDFWRELKRKAGLAPDHWSETLRVERYTVSSIPAEPGPASR